MVLSSAKVEGPARTGVQEMEGVLACSGTTNESSAPLTCGMVVGEVTISVGAGITELLEVMLKAGGGPT
jgi:hypothetical protein